jgi:hypothetical protein
MALPEIPDDALAAIRLRLPWLTGHDVDAAVHTALPHLYAAALRHAAENVVPIEALLERHGVATSAGPYYVSQAWRRELRALADEAVRDA